MARIALVGPSWPYRGGISRTTTQLALALERRGSLAAFLVASRQYPRFLYPGTRDIDPHACPRLPFAQPCFGVLQPLSWRRLLRSLRAAAPDAVALPFWTWAWTGMELCLQHGRVGPVVGIIHNPVDHDASWLGRRMSRLVLAGFRGFFCHARAVEEGLRRQFPEVPVALHPLAAEPASAADRQAARRRLGVGENAVAALCFGLIRPYKGVEVLLAAMRRLAADSPLVLLLAGEPWGSLGAEMRRQLADPLLAARVIARLEWIPEEEVGSWLGAADAMVLPYHAATGSAVAAQALGAGLPLVATRVGGLAEVVEDGVNGLLIPPGDATALALALGRLADPALRERLARGARAAASRWSWDSYAAALERLVADVIATQLSAISYQLSAKG
ncbi:MAG: glycosyltransferase [Acidobacteriota bacterium]